MAEIGPLGGFDYELSPNKDEYEINLNFYYLIGLNFKFRMRNLISVYNLNL